MKKLVCTALCGVLVLSCSMGALAQTDYVVKKGDTLWQIAKTYGTTYQELAKVNEIANPDLIYPGQVVSIPEKVEEKAETATSVTTPQETAPATTPEEAKPEETTPATEEVTSFTSAIDLSFSESVIDTISALGDNPDVGNRSAGSAAEKEAANYLYETMQSIGLSNVTMDTFTCDNWSFEKARVYLSDDEYLSLGGYATQLVCDMEPLSIVYGGQGTAADLENLDVEGKLVLIEIDQHNNWWINHPAYQAHLKGAKAVIAYNNSGYAQYDENTIGVQDICGPADAPALGIDKAGFDRLKSLIDENGGEATVTLDAKSVVTEDGTSQNVWGEIPGKTDDVIYLIAHYDGYFHSAFDDASGVATCLGLAKAIVDSGYQPEKTIRIVLHGAEEWGVSNVEYDWAKGAFEQINTIHPEWAQNAYALLNIDGMYAIEGQKDFALATVYELRDFTEAAIAPVVAQYPQYTVTVQAPTSTGTEDFSYSQAGVPAIVAADVDFEHSTYDQNVYHSSKDSKEVGFNREVFQMVHEIFAQLVLSLDETAVRPMNFSAEFAALEESLNQDLIASDHEIYAALASAKEAAAALDAKIAAQDETDSAALNDALFDLFKDIRQNLVSFTWETEIVFPTEQCQTNIEALTGALEALKNGDGDLAYDEYLYAVDYNWYAYDFDEEAYTFQLSRMQDNAVGTWGEGMLKTPGENLYDVVTFLGDHYGEENVDYSSVITTLEEALARQQAYLDDLTNEETQTLLRLTEKMNQAL